MNTFANELYEMEFHRMQLEAEVEPARWAQSAGSARPKIRKEWGFRQVVLWLGDMGAALRCQLRARIAIQQSSPAC